jgi:hypothetical protein
MIERGNDKMKVQFNKAEDYNLSQFMEKYSLTLDINERERIYIKDNEYHSDRYYASFAYCETKNGVCLVGTYSNGATPVEAVEDYIKKLKGKLLIFKAMDENRKEIFVGDIEITENDKQVIQKRIEDE